MFKSVFRGLKLGLLALAFVATAVDAQGIGVRRSQSAGKGWIGISTSIRASIRNRNSNGGERAHTPPSACPEATHFLVHDLPTSYST